MKKMYVVPLALFLFVFVGMVGMAKAAVETVAVSATVLEACSFSGPGAMAFGNYNGSAIVNASATLNINCVAGSFYDMSDDDGLYETGIDAPEMAFGINRLAYTTDWVDRVGALGAGAETITINGSIAAAQFVPAGVYGDTITFTITY
ncbi:MAG TPA: spore coat protein U domain-containing protein [Thermodesulfobacteriota bacterium]|nr:spore coat protein U domain-containing protein [Thermodesulfobacteriota bacterium]